MEGKKILSLKLDFNLKTPRPFILALKMGKLPESQNTSNNLNVFFPFPTCLSELDFKRGNISVADLLKAPISDQQKGCSGVCLLWAEDNFKKHRGYLDRAGWEAGATGMDHQKLPQRREQGWEDLPGKCVRRIPSEQMWGLQSL